jgi:aryl-alcohol dehydrogenase (NADP+)
MQYVNLGQTGLKVSRLCLGTMTYGSSKWRPWVLDEDAALPFFKKAIEAGINFFDTADMYSVGMSETVVGRALRECTRRDDVVIATKVFFPMGPGPNDRGLSRKHILMAIEASLRRLATEYVDLYQIHRLDPETPVEETLEALHDVVKSGKALHVGASSMYAWQFAKMLSTAGKNGWTKFVSMQNHLNLIYREEEREMMPLCREEGIGVIPYSPLARGFLAGDRKPGGGGDTVRANSDKLASRFYFADTDFAIADRVGDTAKQRGVSRMQIALAWMLSRPGVTSPIIGASRLTHLDEAVDALEVQLTVEECANLEESYQPHPVVGPL